MNKILKLLCTVSMLFSFLCFSACRTADSSELDYAKVWTYAQSRTLQFQCVLNTAEEMEANVFNTVLTQIAGTATLEYKKDTCAVTMNALTVKITAGEVDFQYDSAVKYTDERDILRNTPFRILLDKRLECEFAQSGKISGMEGYDTITEALDRQAGRSEPAYQIKRTFYEYFSEDTLKFLLERTIGSIPFSPILENSTIGIESANVLPYGLDFNSAFRYNGLPAETHEFDITGSVSAAKEYNGIKFDLYGETMGKMKLYESSGSSSRFREGYEQSSLKGTETYADDGQTIARRLSLTVSLQYEILNN